MIKTLTPQLAEHVQPPCTFRKTKAENVPVSHPPEEPGRALDPQKVQEMCYVVKAVFNSQGRLLT